jgi:hypothetical protein
MIFGTHGANGWYVSDVTVNWNIQSALPYTSTGCDGVRLTADTVGTRITCTATNDAGETSVTVTIKRDVALPAVTPTAGRLPDSNGWYNHSLSVHFVGTDATSGVASCVPDQGYSGPDDGAATVSGTCTDNAGNVGAASFPLRYDASPPTVNGTRSRSPDSNGWYNHSLSVHFTGTDSTSGLASCVPDPAYSGPDSASASVMGTCHDTAGNAASLSVSFSYDATAPTATATPSRNADSNGWYNHELSVHFDGADATSGLATGACTPDQSYSGPDSANASVLGTCTDRAGNLGSRSFPVRYDATAPTITPTPGRSPDANGWYNQAVAINFVGSDPTSGIDTCTQVTYSGPDSGNASVSGSCRDRAGNPSGTSTFGLRYDATAPQVTRSAAVRGPDSNGWYNQPISVAFSGTDATSGIDACSQPAYGGPDAAAASVSGFCRDNAGNQSATSSFALSYDATGPQVTSAVAVRPPDQAGWYNHAITFAFQGQDAMSGFDRCAPTTYAGPDGANASVTGACFDLAGNRGTATFPVKYDGTGPAVTASAGRGSDADGWYNHPLTVSFDGIDGASGVASCAPPQAYDGPDSAAAGVTGSCLDKAGNVAFGSIGLKYDATAPQALGATTVRGPDSNGWFNHPLTVDFHGSDATSQIAACTEAGYAGPDNAAAVVSGSCRDHAGNTSGSIDYGLKYDATPPGAATVNVSAGDRMAVVRWHVSQGTTSVDLVRFAGTSATGVTVYTGTADSYTDRHLKNGVRYRYEVKAFDDAGNVADSSATAAPKAPLYRPAAGAKVSSPPLLAWAPAPRARYYNVQIWRGRKIFSAWPSGTRLQLTRSWTYRGREYHLSPGRYRWYVWPGYGARAAKRYGRLLGASSFVVVAR